MVTFNGHSRKKLYIKCPNVFQPTISTGPAGSKLIQKYYKNKQKIIHNQLSSDIGALNLLSNSG